MLFGFAKQEAEWAMINSRGFCENAIFQRIQLLTAYFILETAVVRESIQKVFAYDSAGNSCID